MFLVSCRFTSNDRCGSRRICLDPDVVPPLTGFRFYAILGVFYHVLSVPSVCMLTVFDLFVTPLTMFKASTTLFDKKFLYSPIGIDEGYSQPIKIKLLAVPLLRFELPL